MDGVAVGLARDIRHHVEVRADLLRRDHHDIARQTVVERHRQPVHGHRAGGIDHGHLPPGVDAGIRAAGSLHVGRTAQDRGRRGAEHPLHGRQPRLNLPAVVVRTIVGDHQLDPTPRRPGRRWRDRRRSVFCFHALSNRAATTEILDHHIISGLLRVLSFPLVRHFASPETIE